MSSPLGLVDTAVEAVAAQAGPLGLAWQIRIAEVLQGDDPALVKLRLDGDATAVTFGVSMVGPLAVGARVYTITTPPAGVYVVGWTGAPSFAPTFVYKTVDETVNGSDVLQDDDDLVLAVEATGLYRLELRAVQNSGATPAFKCAFTLPSGATWLTGSFDCGSSAANEQFGLMSTTLSGVTGAGANSAVIIHSLILVGSTAGTIQWQWAQNTANASNTIVRAGSSLLLSRMA